MSPAKAVFTTMGLVYGPAAVLLAVVALASCATKPPPSPPPQALAKPICLPMVSYSKAEQSKAADELQALPQGSELAAFVRDYGALRAADRAVCDGEGGASRGK